MEKQTTTAKSKITRRNYSRISGSLELPNLVEIQTNSYKWFKEATGKEHWVMYDNFIIRVC